MEARHAIGRHLSPPSKAAPPAARALTAAVREGPSVEFLASAARSTSELVRDTAGSTVLPDPLAERDAGYAVIGALQQKGQFNEAATYALRAPAAYRRDLVIAAFHDWARQQSDAAFVAASNLADPSARDLALQSALSGWSRRDPAGLAETALRFTDGGLRDVALTKALRAWMHADPWSAGDWILGHGDHVVSLAENMFQLDQR